MCIVQVTDEIIPDFTDNSCEEVTAVISIEGITMRYINKDGVLKSTLYCANTKECMAITSHLLKVRSYNWFTFNWLTYISTIKLDGDTLFLILKEA